MVDHLFDLIFPRKADYSNSKGMSVTELMVSLTVMIAVAAAAIPSFMTYSQQSIVITQILPPLRMIEMDIAIHYDTHQAMPDDRIFSIILQNHTSENINLALKGNSLNIVIDAPESDRILAPLNNMPMYAYPIFSKRRISGWTLKGVLAERLGIDN